MKHHLTLVTALLLAPLIALSADCKPGEVWLDTAGQPMNAHGGGMLFYKGAHYWYGENKEGRTWLPQSTKAWDGYRVDVTGIRCYSSRDLLNWKDEGLVLKAVPDDPKHDLHPSKVCERPKVVFNSRTKKFVMWMHIDSEDYQAARAGVAVADKPIGPFTYIESVRPEGQDSRDQTLFQDDDGKAYRVYSSENNDTTHISLLTDDYLKHSGKFARVFEKRRMEAQTLFKHAGRYWFIASDCTGWDPNPARSAVANSIWGPWTELGNPCRGQDSAQTFGGQSAYVFPVAGRENAFIFMADRWNKTNLVDSRYLWLPLQFQDNKSAVDWMPQWNLSVFTRETVPPEPVRSAKKKGVGFWNRNGRANALSEKVDVLGCGWYYNWSARPDPNAKMIKAEFVPMIWSSKDVTETNLRRVRESGSATLLGFNEPDVKDQADMTVDQALELWPKLIATGLRLGSPAPGVAVNNGWLPKFMQEAARRNNRVDFICLHWYNDITHPDAVDHLRQFLTDQWERFGKPIWLTEFSGTTGDWVKPAYPPVDVAKNAEFARKALPMLESLPFVEGYAWFELKWTGRPREHVALVDPKTGGLTLTGKAYRDGDVAALQQTPQSGSAALTVVAQPSAAAADIVTVHPKRDDTMLLNPGKGWVQYYGSDKYTKDYIGIGYTRWAWSVLEPKEGQYNWKEIDGFINQFKRHGKKTAFGVMSVSTGLGQYVTPKWVFDAGAIPLAVPDDSSPTGQQFIPKTWDDPVFLKKLKVFVQALGKRYDGNPDIAFLDIRSYGNWGEGHIGMLKAPVIILTPPDNLKANYIQPYVEVFPHTQLMIVWGSSMYDKVYDWAVSKGAGMRRDGILSVYSKDGSECFRAYGHTPAVFEYCDGYAEMKKSGWWKPDMLLNTYFQAGKPSYMQWNPKIFEENTEFCLKLGNKVGYHFILQQATVPIRIESGKPLSMQWQWLNDGVAPLYESCHVAIALLDQKDQLVQKQWLTDSEPKNWKPGASTAETVRATFASVPSQTYQLAVGLFLDQKDANPDYRLGIQGRTAEGWYVLLGRLEFIR